MTLSEFLRDRQGLIGTKIVCAEGDCGACSVLVGRPSEDLQSFRYQTIDSCIVFMHQLDCRHVVTVEGLQSPESGELSAVQDAMIQCHGSQCGFCTPGFVVTMHGLCEEHFDLSLAASTHRLDEGTLRLGLSGNLCRCTGYFQIIEAGRAIEVDRLSGLNELYPPTEMLVRIAEADAQSVRIAAGDQMLLLPCSLAEAGRMKAKHPDARIVSGATDVGVWHNHGGLFPSITIGLGRITELTRVEEASDRLRLSAGVTWTRLIEFFDEPFPAMADILRHSAAPRFGTSAPSAATWPMRPPSPIRSRS